MVSLKFSKSQGFTLSHWLIYGVLNSLKSVFVYLQLNQNNKTFHSVCNITIENQYLVDMMRYLWVPTEITALCCINVPKFIFFILTVFSSHLAQIKKELINSCHKVLDFVRWACMKISHCMQHNKDKMLEISSASVHSGKILQPKEVLKAN